VTLQIENIVRCDRTVRIDLRPAGVKAPKSDGTHPGGWVDVKFASA